MMQFYKFVAGYLFLAIIGLGDLKSQTQIEVDSATTEFIVSRLEKDFLERKKFSIDLAERMNWTLRIEGGANEASSELMDVLEGVPVYYTTTNTNAAGTISTNHILPQGSTGLNLSGNNLSIGIWDGGAVRGSHQELNGRVTQVDGATGLSWHATHVSGTLAASGILGTARGMAPSALIKAYNWSNDNAEMSAAANNGLLISNHSYGQVSGWAWGNWSGGGNQWHWFGNALFSTTEDWTFGMYESKAAQWDAIMYNNPNYLIVKSVGNDRGEGPSDPIQHKCLNAQSQWVDCNEIRPLDGGIAGYDCIPTYGTAKNILSIGAINDIPNGYQQAADVVLAAFSSCGPTDDGRIKPDLVANGVTLLSSHSNNNSSYSISSGTSMSSPSVAGSLLLLQEHYINVYGTNMTATMLKGLAIHTADEAGVAPGPDYKHGWGLLNAKNAALAITDDEHFSFFDSTLFQGQTHRYDFFANGTDPVKVTIAWNDTSGPVFFALNNPTARLVNNLDIRIRSYHCDTVIYPWTLNPANPSADATIGDNFRDNIEVIGDFTLPTGDYYVEVTHKNNLYSGKQRYSVIIQSSTYSVEPYDTIVYLSAPITLPIPESWVMPEPYFIWLSNSPKVNFILDEDSILVDAFEMGYDTLYLASCSQAWGCDFCDTVFIALDIRSCSENVNEQGSSQVVDIIPACSDDEGWFYFKDPVTNATLLGIKPNGNDFNPSLVRIDASTNGNFQLPPPLSASLMPYMLTINAPGTYNINGGLSVKLFYPSSSKNIVENDYEFSEWFKHPGSKEDVLNDFNAVPFSVQILEVQDTGSVNGVSFVVFDSISSFSTFGFTGWDNPAVLPVTWYSFDAKIQDKAVMLEWTTASEFNNKGFYVEYATNDLIFKNIGFVSGNGTTSIPSMYTFKHEKPGVGILYYRIRQVDFDGTFDYSVIRSVEYSFEVSNFINVYPNPAGDKIRVESNNALGFINIYDTTGRLMLSVNSDEKALDIDLANIHTGALFIQTKNGTKYILKN